MAGRFDDDFWEIDEKYKRKPTRSSTPYKRSSTEAHDIISDGHVSYGEKIPRDIPYQKKEKHLIFEYSTDNIFINRVKITSYANKDKEPSLFMRERAAILERHGQKCEKASFFSLSPRYSQLTKNQLQYYLWWRENIRNSIFLPCDPSYISLYINELTAIGSNENPRDSVNQLSKLFFYLTDEQYFGTKFKLIRNLLDMCLRYNIDFPIKDTDSTLSFVTECDIAKELLCTLSESTRHTYASVAINNISIYSYKKSKYYVGNEDIFNTHIKNAIQHVFDDDKAYKEIANAASGAFSTLLYSKKLFSDLTTTGVPPLFAQVSYYPINCISGIITNAVRYTENKLREVLHIRPKLAISELPDNIQKSIDRYFIKNSEHFPKIHQKSKEREIQREIPEYERLYDLPKTELSLENAALIEKSSWETTFKLTEAFSCDDEDVQIKEESVETPILKDISDVQNENDDIKTKLRNYMGFINACNNSNMQTMLEEAKKLNMNTSEITDAINEIALEYIGDILIEENDGEFSIIEDYKELIL